MWAAIKAILLGLGAFLTVVAKAVERKRAEQVYQDAQNSADRIAADPGGEWMRRFQEQRSPAAPKAHTGELDRDA